MCDSGKTLQEKKTSGKIKYMTLVHKGSEYHSCDSQDMRFGDRWKFLAHSKHWAHNSIKLINPHCIYNTEQCNPLRSPSALWNVIFFPQNKGNYKDHGLSL